MRCYNTFFMKIYNSTEYFDKTKLKEWIKLCVISRWDWNTNSICHQKMENGITIFYCLEKHIKQIDGSSKYQLILSPTVEMKTEIEKMGYVLSNGL